jgi:hypothetical protein
VKTGRNVIYFLRSDHFPLCVIFLF